VRPSCEQERESEGVSTGRWGRVGSKREGARARAGLVRGDGPKRWMGVSAREGAARALGQNRPRPKGEGNFPFIAFFFFSI
jgi:hypothetical protein